VSFFFFLSFFFNYSVHSPSISKEILMIPRLYSPYVSLSLSLSLSFSFFFFHFFLYHIQEIFPCTIKLPELHALFFESKRFFIYVYTFFFSFNFLSYPLFFQASIIFATVLNRVKNFVDCRSKCMNPETGSCTLC
jgi:hypothetical protein